jgi:hypothetical protein
MSIQETNFLKWFGGIAAILIAASIIGLIGMYRAVAVVTTDVTNIKFSTIENWKFINNTKEKFELDLKNYVKYEDIQNLKDYHNMDVQSIKESVNEIKDDNKEIKQDIKAILRVIK